MRTERSERYWLWLLLTVVCLPRITIDFYLPGLPAIGASLHASSGGMAATMSVYMAAYALSTLLCGPLADRHGRRPVLWGGAGLYLAATLACALAGSMAVVIAGRFLQALGAGCGTVIGRAMVKDRYAPSDQVRLMALLSAGMSLSPVLAPLPGAAVVAFCGWRGSFGLLAVGALLLLAALVWLPETRAGQWAGGESLRQRYRRLLTDRHFLRCTLTISLGYCTYFAYVSASPVLLEQHMHLSPLAYATCFSLSVPGYLGGTRLMRRLSASRSVARVLDVAVALNLAACLVLCAATFCWPSSPAALVLPMIPVMLSVGMLIPACQVSVLQPYGDMAATASGLFFFLQMSTAALCAWLAGLVQERGPAPLAVLILLAACGAFLAWRGLAPRSAVCAPGAVALSQDGK